MIKLVSQHSYFEKNPNKQMGRFQRNPSIGWVHPKSTLACPLTWANNKSTLFKLKEKTKQLFNLQEIFNAKKLKT